MRLPIFSLLALAPCAAVAAVPTQTYAVTATISGPDGGWDYAKADPADHRLYVARSASVTVVDLANGNQVSSIGDIMRGHAVVPLPGKRLLVTSGNDATVRFIDLTSGKEVARLAVGKKPDAAIYDASGHRALVMNAESGTVSIIDTDAMRVTRTIAVKPALEYAVIAGSTLFVNDEDANEIEAVDLANGKAGKPIAMPGCEGPTGLAYDEPHARLISACANGKAMIVDAKARRVVAAIDIGKGADAVILDPARRLAFIPCGRDGVLDVLSLNAPGSVTLAQRVTTEIGARTGALDPATGAIYLPTARFGAPDGPGRRPTVLPGTFHILVVQPK